MGVMYVNNPATSSEPAHGLSAKAFSIQYLEALYSKKAAWKHMHNFDADVSSFGESVSLPSFPRLTAVDVTVSTGAVASDSTSIVQQTVQINKMKAVRYEVPEYVLKQSKIDVMSAFSKEAANAVADSVDAAMVGLLASLSTNSAGTANTDLTEALALGALAKLAENYVPLDNPADLVWILPASQFGPVHALKGYAAYQITPGANGTDGAGDVRANVDTLYGIDVVWRNDTALSVTSGKIGGLFHKDSVGVAFQRMPSMREPMPITGTINTELLCHALFGINLIKETSACLVLCK